MIKSNLETLPQGTFALPGIANPEVAKKKQTSVNSKTEHVVADKLPKNQKSSFQSLKEFKSLKELNTKDNKDTIYFHKKKGFLIEKRSNGFVEFLKTIFLVNVFKYNLFGYSSNDKKVYSGLKKLISDLPTLQKKAESNKNTQNLMKTIVKTNSVLDVIRSQYEKNGKDIDAGAIENLQTKIARFANKHSSPLVSKIPGFAPPPPPPPMLKQTGQPMGQLTLGEIKLSPAAMQGDKEAAKPKLPPLESYEIPKIEVKAALGDFQLAQTRKQKRSDLLQNLNEYYQEFVEARNELIRLDQDLEKIAAKLQPKQQQTQASSDMPPPPPSTDVAPPPPPPPPPSTKSGKKQGGPPKLTRKMTFRELQLEKLKGFKVSPTVKLNEEIIKFEEKRDLAIDQIKETLFPGINGLSFTTDKEIEALDHYVKSYQAQANQEVDELQEVVERTNPFNKSSSPPRVDGNVVIDQPKESETVVKLRKMLGDIARHQKAIGTNEQKIKNYSLDMRQAKKDRSVLSDKMALKRIASSYTTADKQKDVKALQAFRIKAADRKKDIATSKESITSLNDKINGLKKVLAYEIHMDMNSELEAVIARVNELIDKES